MKKTNKRLHNQTYSLTVEGECEELYFLHLKNLINSVGNRVANCKFEPSIAIKKNPLRRAKAFNGYKNKFFHIQDIEDFEDTFQKEKFYELIKDIKSANDYVNYKLGYTNYSFELWIILHKRYMNHSVSHRKNYIKYINECYNTNYEFIEEYKKKENFLKILERITLNDVYFAIEQAKKIRECNKNETCCAQNQKRIVHCNYTFYSINPDLDIHEIIEVILNECLGRKYNI